MAVLATTAHEPHRTGNRLRDVILGGQDGLVNMLGIILGVVAAGGSTTVLIAAGLAAAITESISMGAVAYTSTLSDRDYYRAEEAREREEMRTMPEVEREEIREIYAAKGFRGPQLDMVVETITSDPEVWLRVMMEEELHLQPVDTTDVLRSAAIVTVACLIGHLLPLVPFMILARTPAVIAALLLSAVTLFGVGAYGALTRIGDWRAAGLRMVAIGLGSAALGFLVSRLIGARG